MLCYFVSARSTPNYCPTVGAQIVWSCYKVAGPVCGNEASYLAMIGQTGGTLAAYQVTRYW